MSYSTDSLQIVPEQGVNHVTGIHLKRMVARGANTLRRKPLI